MKRLEISDINELYRKGVECDDENFAEMRTNVLLVAGQHFNNKTGRYVNQRSEERDREDSKRIRVTKNFIPKVVKAYKANILEKAPWVSPEPANALEAQDKKAAELNKSVWDALTYKSKLKTKRRKWVGDFVEIGEVHTKIFWDPNAGEFVGYEQEVDEFGVPMTDPMTGGLKADESKPKFKGAMCFKDVYGFNLLREPGTQTLEESPWLIERHMIKIKTLESVYAGNEKVKKMLEPGSEEDYIIFDADKQRYRATKDDVLVRELYIRPCFEYPNGYFYISTQAGILEEGEIPYGIWPYVSKCFDENATLPRGKSPIKIAKTFQNEINRASSQQAMHHLTVGDDKIVYQAGTKLAQGALLPGVRGISHNGMPPQILPGRDGGQFSPYIESTKNDLFDAVDYDRISQEKGSQMDVYSMLFMSARGQKVYGEYVEKFTEFLTEVCEKTLELARHYLPDDEVIKFTGRTEIINLAEFRATKKGDYAIKVVETTDAIEERIGRQLILTQMIQYLGKNLDQKQIGMVLKNMPFLNNQDLFKELTLDTDMVENDMLQLERGEMPTMSPYADNAYYEKRLSHRMKQADFRFLHPSIQKMYEYYLNLHVQEIGRKELARKQAESGFIPIDGALITVQMYDPNPEPGKPAKYIKLPYSSVMDLLKKLESQGTPLKTIQEMNSQNVSAIANQLQSQEMMGQGPAPALMGA